MGSQSFAKIGGGEVQNGQFLSHSTWNAPPGAHDKKHQHYFVAVFQPILKLYSIFVFIYNLKSLFFHIPTLKSIQVIQWEML